MDSTARVRADRGGIGLTSIGQGTASVVALARQALSKKMPSSSSVSASGAASRHVELSMEFIVAIASC